MVDPVSLTDGTYTVKVERVVDAKHVQVMMDDGKETTLTAGRAGCCAPIVAIRVSAAMVPQKKTEVCFNVAMRRPP